MAEDRRLQIAGYPAVSLPRRFGWAAAARLVVLSALLIAIVIVNVRGSLTLESHTVQLASATLLVAFGLSGLYAWFLRQGRQLETLVSVQLVFDQAIWSVIVYLTGGATSGATSLYGISCLFGAILAGFRGAALAAASAGTFYALLVMSLELGVIEPPPDQPIGSYHVSTEDIVYGGVINLLVLVVVALLAGNLTERLRATGGQLVRAEERALQAEREAALGRLAAGLAHEIRNPLGSISGSVRILAKNPLLDAEDKQLCEIIDSEASRLNELVSDMLNLAKPKKPELTVIDAAAVVREVCDLASHTGRGVADVEVRCEAEDELRVHADEGMLRQMLWNLVRNGVQASTSGEHVLVRSHARDGAATVEIVDHGEGIDDESKQHLFDAFFTTRSKGTGIGLAVVKRIVDEHGWTILVSDTAGGGATFTVGLGTTIAEPLGRPKKESQRGWTLFPGPS